MTVVSRPIPTGLDCQNITGTDQRLNQCVVACRGELGLAVREKRKNLESHLSQRNGRKQIRARTVVSMIPRRLD